MGWEAASVAPARAGAGLPSGGLGERRLARRTAGAALWQAELAAERLDRLGETVLPAEPAGLCNYKSIIIRKP